MASDWPELSLDDVSELIVDCPHSTPKWTDEGVVVLRNQYIRNGRLDLSAPSYTTEEGYWDRIKRAVPTIGDLVLTREAPMGEVCQIPEGLRCCLGQRMVLVRANQKIIEPKYLLFVLQSPYLQHQISWSEGTGTTVSNIRIPNLKAFRIPTPPLSEQKAIAHILGTLDDKIELNRQMNATLETMAQALFKSWFVDFDPIIDNAQAAGHPIPETLQTRAEARAALGDQRKPLPEAIQKQFPNRFVFNGDMGWVPEGWDPGLLSHIATLTTESVHPQKEPERLWTHFSIPAFDDGQHPTLDMGETIKSGKYRVPPSAVLASKLNPQFPRVWMPNVEDELNAICSTEFMPFVPNDEAERPFLYSLFCSETIQTEIENRVTGSTGSRQRVKPKEIAELPLVVVPTVLRREFSEVAGAWFDRQSENKQQQNTLSQLRDTLLPKLLSGQLRIPDAEKQLAEAL